MAGVIEIIYDHETCGVPSHNFEIMFLSCFPFHKGIHFCIWRIYKNMYVSNKRKFVSALSWWEQEKEEEPIQYSIQLFYINNSHKIVWKATKQSKILLPILSSRIKKIIQDKKFPLNMEYLIAPLVLPKQNHLLN